MSLISSPRARRRLLWLTPVLGVAVVAAAVVWLLPSQGGTATANAPPAQGNPTLTGPLVPAATSNAAADVAARRAADKDVRPLANAFVADVVQHRKLAEAHALLDPELRAKYSLDDWQAGDHLPFSADDPTVAPSTILSFYGPKAAGFVSSVGVDDGAGGHSTLVAVRFAKTDGRWLVDYLHHDQSSRFVSQANYAPHGFLPGSHTETLWTWAILVLGFAAVVAIVAFLDRWLSRGGRGAEGQAA